jgi:hypothetical protein
VYPVPSVASAIAVSQDPSSIIAWTASLIALH